MEVKKLSYYNFKVVYFGNEEDEYFSLKRKEIELNPAKFIKEMLGNQYIVAYRKIINLEKARMKSIEFIDATDDFKTQ